MVPVRGGVCPPRYAEEPSDEGMSIELANGMASLPRLSSPMEEDEVGYTMGEEDIAAKFTILNQRFLALGIRSP